MENLNYALQAFCPMTSINIDRRFVHIFLQWTLFCHFMPPLKAGIGWKQGILTHSVSGNSFIVTTLKESL